MKKLRYFEYTVQKLVEWYNETGSLLSNQSNDFNKLKVLKLHFFVSAISSNENDLGLLKIFDKFCAMPYGHVESQVYDNLKHSIIQISRNGIENLAELQNIDFPDVEENIKDQINEAISKLKDANPSLINYSPFMLVDLSHAWSSWRTMYRLAKQLGKSSIAIPTHMIQREEKMYALMN